MSKYDPWSSINDWNQPISRVDRDLNSKSNNIQYADLIFLSSEINCNLSQFDHDRSFLHYVQF